MGTHRNERAARRGVSRGVVIAAVSVVVLVALVFGWMRLRDVSTEQGTEAAARCVEGDVTLRVAADPTIADTMRVIAERFEATAPVVRDRCVRVAVDAVDASTAVTTITTADADADALPDLWIAPDSSAAARVAERTASTPRSLAASPVVLAAGESAADYLRAANPTWGALAGVLGASGAPAPLLPIDPITTSAGTAMVADYLGLGTAAPTEQDVTSAAGQTLLADLGAASLRTDSPAPADVAAALDAVSSSTTESVAVSTVAFATAQQVAQRSDLQAVAPVGATPVADYPAVIVQPPTAQDDSAIAIAGELLGFARYAGAEVLRSAGFVPVEEIAGARATDSPAVADLVDSALAESIGVATTTLLVDVSPAAAATDDGTAIRNAVGAAISDVLDRLPDAARVGLVTFGRTDATPTDYDLNIPATALSTPGTDGAAGTDDTAGAATHRDRLRTALDGWSRVAASDAEETTTTSGAEATTASGAEATTTAGAEATSTADAYATVVEKYRTAVADRYAGMPNRVVVISVAANADGTLTAAAAEQEIRSEVTTTGPVEMDAILIGTGPDADEWDRLTGATGGRTEQLDTASGAALPNLLEASF